MLTDHQKLGIRELLTLLGSEEIKSIAVTVTRNSLLINSESDAIEAIFLHSESAEWLLHRQKITRAVLFQYLNKKQVPCPASLDKASLIVLTLSLWNSVKNETKREEVPSITPSQDTVSKYNESQQIALKFTQWFYSLPADQMIAEHFWPNCTVRVTLGQGTVSHEANGASSAADLFRSLKMSEQLQLSPNISEDGVRGARNQHGLVVVAVCGTVHQQGICRGVFEQAFGLIQDPSSENRWKIQWTEARLTEANVNKLPAISDSPELLSICRE